MDCTLFFHNGLIDKHRFYQQGTRRRLDASGGERRATLTLLPRFLIKKPSG